MIKSPTRITTESSTTIDIIVSNNPSHISKSEVISTFLSDHEMVGYFTHS